MDEQLSGDMHSTATMLNRLHRRVMRVVKDCGLLLESDLKLPCVTGLIVGKPVRGSWWGHARGHDIHDVLCRMAEHPDVAVVKLVSGKTTFVHRELWPALVAIGRADEAWQTRGLSAAARRLLKLVQDNGEVRCDQLPPAAARSIGDPPTAARELEKRLLVFSQQFHTERGTHVRRLETWDRWALRVRCRRERSMTLETARKRFDGIVDELNRIWRARARLPWQTRIARIRPR